MEITNVSEYEAIAKQKLPKMVYDYYASGAEDQWTLQENRNAFSRILYAFFSSHLICQNQNYFLIKEKNKKKSFLENESRLLSESVLVSLKCV